MLRQPYTIMWLTRGDSTSFKWLHHHPRSNSPQLRGFKALQFVWATYFTVRRFSFQRSLPLSHFRRRLQSGMLPADPSHWIGRCIRGPIIRLCLTLDPSRKSLRRTTVLTPEFEHDPWCSGEAFSLASIASICGRTTEWSLSWS